MTGLHRPSLLTGFFIALVATLIVISGCEPTCDTIPLQSLAHVRIVNAIPDVTYFDVIIDHNPQKTFERAFYDVDRYFSTPRRQLGYQSKYLDKSTSLIAGTHSITLLDSLGRPIPVFNAQKNEMDTSLTVLFSNRDETLVFGGLLRGTTDSIHMLHLHDELRRSDTLKSLLRVVQVATDIPGIDFYLYNQNAQPAPPPNVSVAFPQISYEDGSGNGTGSSAKDYISFQTADTTLVTVKGDLSPAGQIVKIPYFLSTHGLYGTVIIRGRGAPIDNQPTISVLFIPDGSEFPGTVQINYQFYEVRLVNATRLDTISLLAHNPTIATEKDQARANIPQQAVVFNIMQDTVSQYWRLTTDYHSTVRFVVSKSHYDLSGFDSIPRGDSALKMFVNDRYTFIETETNPFGSAEQHDIIMLKDSLSSPSSISMGRVRFVNASPDHSSITIAGVGQLQGRGSLKTTDLPIGSQTINVSDGTNSATITINVQNDTPINVIFTAARSGKPFPFTIARK